MATTVKMSNTVNTVAATISLSSQGTNQMPACTLIRGRTITLMQSSTAAQSVAIGMMKKMRRMKATGQMLEVQLAA